MKTAIVNKDFLTADEYVEMHLDSKYMYVYLLICPDRGYLTVYKFNRRLAGLVTGMSGDSIDIGIKELELKGYVELYDGYVGLLKADSTSIAGQYGGANKLKELSSIPVNVREHFNLDDENVVSKETVKKVIKKRGPPPETIKDVLEKQPEELRPTLLEFIEDRIDKKRAPTVRAVKGWITKLNDMYPNNPKLQAQSLQQSIDNDWLGIFPVKNNDRSSENREFM